MAQHEASGGPNRTPPLPDLLGKRHALGPAVDTPDHLRALVAGTADSRRAATEHLDAAIVPGGRASEVTGPVAEYVIGVLRADLVLDAGAKVELLYFLGQVTEAAEGPEKEAGVPDCRVLLPAVLAVAEHCEADADPDVRTEAADAAEAAVEVMERLGRH